MSATILDQTVVPESVPVSTVRTTLPIGTNWCQLKLRLNIAVLCSKSARYISMVGED